MRPVWLAFCFWLIGSSLPSWAVDAGHRLVLAHYMVCCPISGPNASIDDHIKEIFSARANGIDGFVLNFMSYPGSPSYLRHAATMDKIFEAASRVPDFYIVLSFDQVSAENSISVLQKYSMNSRSLRRNGKLVISGWGQTPKWTAMLRKLGREIGLELFIVVHMNYPVQEPKYILFPEEERNLRMARVMLEDDREIDGVFTFGAGGPYSEIAKSYPIIAKLYHSRGKLMMAGISAYYRGFNANSRVFENDGFEGMRARWLAAIEGGADWIQFVTWNDWDEATYLQPFGKVSVDIGTQKSWKNLLDHSAFLRASRYYLDWFKTGHKPKIENDRIFYFYRPHLAYSNGVVDFKTMKIGRPANWEKLNDRIFFASYLKAQTDLTVSVGNETYKLSLAEGAQSASVPMALGDVRINVARNGQTLGEELLPLPIGTDASASGNFNYLSGELVMKSQ